ncbi:alpha-amylase family glycosyl hydrolase [Flavimarina sp. Hel_I_48]|uniref:alpha-amylase family glycosyl hydrolase n=1 Tax=Flavimarina sp. Hel_I_48 TaxID=1392488 RepID=UPI0004DEEE6C|nr:alpha-amylase family glycosyl hydrolase [Flavimarina sp. Hel_I_48]
MSENSKVEGMGAIITDEGVGFRVWAPNAHQIFVVGDFNDWQNDKNELFSEDNGYWFTLVSDAKVGDEYKFYIRNGDTELYKMDPYAREVTNSNGNSIVAKNYHDWSVNDFKISSWNSLVIYELHIGTFFRNHADQVGDFDSVTNHLRYLRALGINCIEIMPVAEFPGGQSWGYNPSSPFAIEQDYGGQDALARLIDEAHKIGIAVIMDVVYNHFGPSDLDLWRFDGWSENDRGGIYFYNDWKAETPWGSTRPDYGREEVRRYIRDNAFMWLERFNCDGLRWDATAFIREADGGLGMENRLEEGVQMMRDINKEIQDKYPEKLLIAEDLMKKDEVTNAIENGGIGFNSQWDSGFVHPMRKLLSETNDSDRDLDIVSEVLLFKYNGKTFQRIVYVESHDEVANGKVRLPEMIQPGEADSEFAKKRAVLGAVLVLTAPGIPMLFQGQEFLTDRYFKDDDGLDWEKFSKFKGITKLFKDLIKLRTGKEGSAWGLQGEEIEIVHKNNKDKIFAYYRYSSEARDHGVLVVLNFSNNQFDNYKLGVPSPGQWINKFNTSWEGYDWQFGNVYVGDFETFDENYDNYSQAASISVPAYGGLLFTR